MESSTVDNYLGYFKYEGALIESGYLDAKKSADVLLGIDEVLRYFLYQEDKQLQEIEFEIPVKVQKGSWEALIPESLTEWLLTGTAIAATKYLATAATEVAKNDFKDKTSKDIIKEVFKKIKWIIKIATHVKTLAIRAFNDVHIIERNGEQLVGISNEKGEELYVPKKYLDAYKNCPDKLFEKITKIIEPGRELEIGVNEALPVDEDEQFKVVKIKYFEKNIFYKEKVSDDIIFPELIHGNYVELDGRVTKGNENTNNFGFEYLGHILLCSPTIGNVKDYKDLMFTNCKIKGYVSRMSEDGLLNERKPKIKFQSLEEIQSQTSQGRLFK